jgi:hypothetical protein
MDYNSACMHDKVVIFGSRLGFSEGRIIMEIFPSPSDKQKKDDGQYGGQFGRFDLHMIIRSAVCKLPS